MNLGAGPSSEQTVDKALKRNATDNERYFEHGASDAAAMLLQLGHVQIPSGLHVAAVPAPMAFPKVTADQKEQVRAAQAVCNGASCMQQRSMMYDLRARSSLGAALTEGAVPLSISYHDKRAPASTRMRHRSLVGFLTALYAQRSRRRRDTGDRPCCCSRRKHVNAS